MGSLIVDGIDVSYGPIQALRGVSLRVDPGEMVALLGANGAGKTTTLRTISGMLAPTAGTVTFDGKRIDGLPPQEVTAHGIAHLPEGRELFASLPVVENLRLGYWIRRKDRSGLAPALDRVMEMFPILRQRERQAAGTLSGGEQQMLAVARALMSSPRLLVVDELSLGLAPIVVQQLFEMLARVNQEGTAVLLVEQFVHLALEHTGRAYVLSKGEVVLEGASRDLLEHPGLIASYLGEEAAGAEPAAPGRAKRRPAQDTKKRRQARASAGAGSEAGPR